VVCGASNAPCESVAGGKKAHSSRRRRYARIRVQFMPYRYHTLLSEITFSFLNYIITKISI
jgi:hypothetical protein